VPETACPFCRTTVSLSDRPPLSRFPCPACGKPVLVPGRVGGFLLHAHIGEGEMGSIYRATDETLGREVAVKLVRLNQADALQSRERLTREACAAGKLNHPRVAQVYSLNFSNGHPYLVMEWVAGLDLAQKFDREGPLDERGVLRMALDVAEGLSALHREGLVHGDIKPANIVLDRDGNAKLVDFGLSGMTRRDGEGNFIGTPYFIAPELLHGVADTHGSDLYSLGATLYYLLSGRLTHDGATPAEVLKARLYQKPVPLDKRARHLSLPTRRLVMRLIDRNPAKRPADSETVAAEIREALARLEAVPPREPGAFAERASRFASRLFRPAGLFPRRPHATARHRPAILLALLAAAVAGGLVVAARHPAFERPRARLRQSLADRDLSPETLSAWFRREVSGPIKARMTPPIPLPKPEPAAPAAQGAFTTEGGLVWQSMVLGSVAQRGSTLYTDGTLIVQSTGAEMWDGLDRCRFVWTGVAGDYVFSAQVQSSADTHPLAITGLLVKGNDPAQGPGLLFGFLGSGELFLQLRRESGETELIKRETPRSRRQRHLRLSRRGDLFEAGVSADGREWTPFALCPLELPAGNAVGFAVSPHVPRALATAKFTAIQVQGAEAPPPRD
jgi:serine/threonine-protein kinase